MLRSGITTKVFALMMAIFIVFITGALYMQTAFFENFYTTRKAEALDEGMESFANLYANSDWTSGEIKLNTMAFERANGVKMAILDASYNMLNEEKYYISIRDFSGLDIALELNGVLSGEAYSNIKDIKAGDKVSAEGYLIQDGERLHLSPVRLIVENQVIVDYKTIYGYEGASDTLDRISGQMVSANLPSESTLIQGIEDHALWSVVDYWNREYNILSEDKDRKGTNNKRDTALEYQAFVYSDPLSDARYLTRVYPLKAKSETHYAVVIASHLPILEAVETLSAYYAIIVLAAIIMSIFLSYIVSRLVTRPLLKINNIAGQMAKLDFSSYIEVTTDDEIGHLSQSLNTLSMNLQSNMEELRLANQQLQRDIEKERALEQMRRSFVSGASHELKTPIGIIKGFAEGIRDGIATGRLDYFVDVILEETDKMDGLVKDMLELSRIEQNPNTLNLETFECVAFVNAICQKFAPEIAERGLIFQREISTVRVNVEADPRRMEQVLTNGLSNALRYARRKAHVILTFEEGETTVRISIFNEGDPIPDDQLLHVWDRFYRVDPSRSKESGGSGLGLSIVREILVQHDVAFGIENRPKGVLFYFDIKKAPVKKESI
jgi:signal transduction histidine kinase